MRFSTLIPAVTHAAAGPLARAQRRFRNARPGSVLILVVALLVLLALIGTAFISTTRIDRYTAVQNTANTQIELLVDGVSQVAQSAIYSSLFDQSSPNKDFRPPERPPGVNGTYENVDAFNLQPGVLPNRSAPPPRPAPQYDKWLMPRVPTVPNPNLPASAANVPYWACITEPLMGGQFESPYFDPTKTGSPFYGNRDVNKTWGGGTSPQFQPDFLTIQSGNSSSVYPAWLMGAGVGVRVLAGDADGDGIADCGLFRLPVGEVNGVTYYGGVRIVDNGSAVNVSTAWKQNDDFLASPYLPGDYFPCNINLQQMLVNAGLYNPTQQMALLNQYRFNITGAWTFPSPVIDDSRSGKARTDFQYNDPYEAVGMQLVRRLDNPGFQFNGKNFRALGISESAAMAYRLCLGNPLGSQSEIESDLLGSTNPSANPKIAKRPYSPDQAASGYDWYNNNFAYDANTTGSPTMPIRALLTATSPVSNLIPVHLVDNNSDGKAEEPLVKPGPVLTGRGPVTLPGMANYPAPVGTSSTPTVAKTNVNTAPFNELWRAYWNVMASAQPDLPADPVIFTALNANNPAVNLMMFRSPVRDQRPVGTPGRVVMTPSEVMQLRSAIAAVNTIDIRDADDNVTSREVPIFLNPTDASPQFRARVYGTEKQPFITQVYVNNDTSSNNPANPTGNPAGYVAIELYNPYPVPIIMNNWCLGLIDRRATAPIPRSMGTLTAFPPGAQPILLDQTTNAPITIPQNSYIVLDNYSPGGGNNAAIQRPRQLKFAAGARIYYVPNLQEVIEANGGAGTGGELVLLRPRRADGQFSKCSDPENQFDEGTSSAVNIGDLVPVDSFDFTGMASAGGVGPGLKVFTRWHYVRASGAGVEWRFVYPGNYDMFAAGGNSRYEVDQKSWSSAASEPLLARPGNATMGAADPNTSFANLESPYPPVQLNNVDFGGPFKTTSGSGNRFPFGGFARNGDILQVPYIGAYQIRDATVAVPAPPTPTTFDEMNSVAIDAELARCDTGPVTSTTTPQVTDESIGRFCPVQSLSAAPGGFSVDDYSPTGSYDQSTGVAGLKYRYRWASHLFDYLTVQAPSADYLPEVDPDAGTTTTLTPNPGPKYPGTPPQPVPSLRGATVATANSPAEAAVPVDGLININTAPWYVLATLPMLPPQGSGASVMAGVDGNKNGVPDNVEYLAKAIVLYRDGNGATNPPHVFQSIFDLNQVGDTASNPALKKAYDDLKANIGAGVTLTADEFRNAFGDPKTSTTDPGNQDGDISPFPGTDGVRGDFEERFLMVNRISNMITTRSDAFTVYVLVQGWRNVGTATPELVVQRREAFVIDRSVVTPQNQSLSGGVTKVNTD